MKNYILTEREQKILEKFLETGQKPKGFRGLKFRIIRNHKKLNQDFTLINLSFKKFSKEKKRINRGTKNENNRKDT